MVSADMALPPTNARAVTGIGESDQLEARRGQDGRSVRITREKNTFGVICDVGGRRVAAGRRERQRKIRRAFVRMRQLS